ncbi:nucleoid-associated protein YgaU [Rhodobacter viridis]|uniref:Nucleoid-associated protein YgaU n=1 Tax=Rhodobacter viridis TaxID=1054202 RepID=A0A318U3M2_9RHOB|nr:LysM peptidoglycan-binding domain-containing protein [Rhodobacter viridis]PYF10023.1 nucleoid-associated protein YgaU [Rhodobacter viridis]
MAEGNRTLGVVVGGGAAGIVVAAVATFWSLGQDAPQPAAVQKPEPAATPVAAVPAPDPAPVIEPARTAPPAPAPALAPVAAAPVTPAPAAPAAAPVARFDTLRVTPAGALTLAGDVAPGAKVELLLDGKVIDTVTANDQGAFASVTSAEPSAAPRALRLRVTGTDGVAKMSEESLTVAPSPLAVAEAATAKGAAPATVAAEVDAAQVLAEKPLLTDATGTPRVLAGVSATLVIDTLALAPDGKITISGRGAPKGALLRAYVDNAEVGLVQGGAEGGFTMQLPAAKPGPHSLRVDALDAAGKVLSRAEQGFEGIAPPPAPAAAPVSDSAAAAPARSRIITIASGNTLWAIARETYGDPYLYVQIFEANRDQIRDPNRIYPGQVFALPN